MTTPVTRVRVSIRRLFPLFGLLLIGLFCAAPAQADEWQLECVDCPKYFALMTDRSLRLDSAGHPHLVYGGDYLYHAWYDGATWHQEVVDPSAGVGFDAALALDASGYAHISYHDGQLGALKYAYQDASGWHRETVDPDPNGDAGYETSLVLDGNGYAHISYNYTDFATDEGDLRYAYQDAGGWHIETVDGVGDVGYDTSLALDGNGYAHIGYDDWGEWSVKYAYQDAGGWHIETVDNDTADMPSIAVDGSNYPHLSYDASDSLGYAYKDASGWHKQIIDTVPGDAVGWYSSLALGGLGLPYISYLSDSMDMAGDLKFAWYDGLAWQVMTVDPGADPADDVGWYTSVALGGNLAHVSYYDATHGTFKYTVYDGSSWTPPTSVDVGANIGQYNAVAVDGDGYARIVYYDYPSRDLKYAYRDASGWHTETADSAGDVGQHASLALDADGQPHVSYFDFVNDDLKFAYKDASGWHAQTVDPAGGRYTSLALESNGYAHVSYRAATGELKHAYQDAAGWHTETVETGLGWYVETSLALDGSGRPHISYGDDTNDDLKYAYKDGSGWHTEAVDSTGGVGRYSSIDLDANDRPRISYYRGTSNLALRHAYWTGSQWVKENVDSDLGALGDSSMAIAADGYSRIAYFDYTTRALKYAYKDASGWHLQSVAPHVGWYLSLAQDANGNPTISYYDQATYDLKVAQFCVPVTAASIAGPVELLTGEEGVFTASYAPLNATLPVILTWDDGTVGATAVYSWTLPGQYTVEVEAANCGGSAMDTHTVTVSEAPPTCPKPLTGVAISGLSTGYTDLPYTFDAAVQPPDATAPVTYTWSPEPAAGQGTALAEYQWAAPGVYTITVEAENCGGTVSDQHVITIAEPPPTCPRPLSGVTITGLSTGYTDLPYTFDAAVQPPDATAPVTYAWSPEPAAGQGTASAEYQWAAPGTYTITVEAENCGGAVSDQHVIIIAEPPPPCPKPLTGVAISGLSTGYTDLPYTFDATIQPPDATAPVTYAWSPEPAAGQGTVSAKYQWTAPGTYTITVDAENCGGLVSDTHVITIDEPPPTCPKPLTGVTITGPVKGFAGMPVTFSAAIQPTDATPPIVYTWSPQPTSGQGTAGATYTWTSPGPRTVTVSVGNCGGTVSDTHPITIWWRVQLPLLLRHK